jgi:hypothetical protein
VTPVARWLVWVLSSYCALLALVYCLAAASTWNTAAAGAAASFDGFPDRIDAPWPWTPTLRSAPPPAVPVAVGGSTPGLHNILTDTEGSVSFVDAHGGQRILDVPDEGGATPGESLLLSPDGTMAAYPYDAVAPAATPSGAVAVRTLRTGAVRRLALSAPPEGWDTPLAWSPDQTRLAVSIAGSSIGVLRLDTGAYTPVLSSPAGLPASARTPVVAAFAPDGTLAVQLDRNVCAGSHCFTLPPGQRLAGKGAFVPGGTSLAVVADAGRDSRITFVSATDGAAVPGTIHLYAVTTLRLIGWWADRALVVAFRPEPVTDLGPLDDEQDYAPTDYRLVQRLSLLAVTPSVSPSSPTRAQELVVLPDQILSIDIADRALAAGRTAPGHAAPAWPARPGVLTALIGLPAAPLAFIAFLAGAIRRERAGASTTR